MISHKCKCIFVHIPKAAGQSVEHFFLNLHDLSWEKRGPLLLKFNPDPHRGPERLAHLKAAEYLRCGHIDEEQFNSYFKFTFVRNPWARLVSEYRYRNYYKNMSFKKFVLEGLPAESDYFDAYRHIVPQYDFLHDDSGNAIVDFIGRFENLQADFDYICSKLGINNSQLPHINNSTRGNFLKRQIKKLLFSNKYKERKNYTDYYDEETKKFVDSFYTKDIEVFNYSFGD